MIVFNLLIYLLRVQSTIIKQIGNQTKTMYSGGILYMRILKKRFENNYIL